MTFKNRPITPENIWQFVQPLERDAVMDCFYVAEAAWKLTAHETLKRGSNAKPDLRTRFQAIRELLWYGTQTSARYARRHFGMSADLHALIRRLELTDDFVSIRKVQMWMADCEFGNNAWIESEFQYDRDLCWLLALLPGEIYEAAWACTIMSRSKETIQRRSNERT